MSRYHLSGRTVAITGSTGGLGSAVATALRDRGANLALLDRDPAALSVQSEVLGGPSVAQPITVDVQDLSSLESAMLEATEHFGRLDVVIANAGIDTVGPMSTLEPSAFERVIDINLTGVWRTFRAAPTSSSIAATSWRSRPWLRSFTHPCRPPTPPARPACGRCATASGSSCDPPA